jgi:hypothetical protein
MANSKVIYKAKTLWKVSFCMNKDLFCRIIDAIQVKCRELDETLKKGTGYTII